MTDTPAERAPRRPGQPHTIGASDLAGPNDELLRERVGLRKGTGKIHAASPPPNRSTRCGIAVRAHVDQDWSNVLVDDVPATARCLKCFPGSGRK